MGSNSTKAFGALGRDEIMLFEPTNLTIVTDKNHPLYDERVKFPLDEALVLNIMAHGIMVPIIVRKNGETSEGSPIVEVVDGRQRVRAAVEANRRLAAEGKIAVRVPACKRRGEDANLFGLMISTNELRKGDSQITRAKKMQRYLDMGRSNEDAAVQFGVTLQTVKNMLALLDLHPDVQKQVESDNLPAMIAKELSKLPREEQPEALTKLLESGNVKGARGVEAAKNVRKGGSAKSDKVRMMSRKQLEGWARNLFVTSGIRNATLLAVMNRILGNEKALEEYPELQGLLNGDTPEDRPEMTFAERDRL